VRHAHTRLVPAAVWDSGANAGGDDSLADVIAIGFSDGCGYTVRGTLSTADA